jgi:transcriptional regulator with XRE-family HTH domain
MPKYFDPAKFTERLRLAIGRHDMNIEEFARRCGFHPPHVSRIMGGKGLPSFATLSTMLTHLPHVDARWLLLGPSKPPRKRP